MKLKRMFLIFLMIFSIGFAEGLELEKNLIEGINNTVRISVPTFFVTACVYFGIVKPLVSKDESDCEKKENVHEDRATGEWF